jgi:hypothetical protein
MSVSIIGYNIGFNLRNEKSNFEWRFQGGGQAKNMEQYLNRTTAHRRYERSMPLGKGCREEKNHFFGKVPNSSNIVLYRIQCHLIQKKKNLKRKKKPGPEQQGMDLTPEDLCSDCQASAQLWAKSMMRTSWMRMNRRPPAIPKYIQVGPKPPCGMKKAPTQPPIMRRYFRPQNPFCRPALVIRKVIVLFLAGMTVLATPLLTLCRLFIEFKEMSTVYLLPSEPCQSLIDARLTINCG